MTETEISTNWDLLRDTLGQSIILRSKEQEVQTTAKSSRRRRKAANLDSRNEPDGQYAEDLAEFVDVFAVHDEAQGEFN